MRKQLPTGRGHHRRHHSNTESEPRWELQTSVTKTVSVWVRGPCKCATPVRDVNTGKRGGPGGGARGVALCLLLDFSVNPKLL